ncbi:MAG: hypothetical protein SPF51_08635 [Candidatus Fimivicinus sp.]|nr:hypothetical protein [Oscillospiraceae bacterium]MDY5591591.1 hypothetical protein [Candidatus Fimivicinus sp.]
MLKRPCHWFFTRLGLGMALASGGAHTPFSRSHLAYQYLQDELIYRYLGEEHIHEMK